MKELQKIKFKVLEKEERGKGFYIEKFLEGTFKFFKKEKIKEEEYKKFYEYIEENNIIEERELNNLLIYRYGDKSLNFVKEYTEGVNQEIDENFIVQLIALNKKSRATELIVNEIKNRFKIYTLRQDDKPEIWIYQEGIYIPQGKTYIKETIREILGEIYTSHLANLILEKIETDTYIQDENFFIEEDPNLIALKNGIFNLKTRELLPFDEKYFFFQKLPIIYNENSKIENIKKFLNDVLKEGDIKTLQELFGFLLHREYKYEKAFMFNGFGSNGKTKLVELIKLFLGIDNCTSISLQRMEAQNNFDLCELHTKLANICSDLSYSSLKETGNFKSLTGRDLISAPRKFKTNIKFVNYAKMVFCANELPKPVDLSNGFFRRWILIDFPYTFFPKEEYEKNKDKPNSKLADPNILEKIYSKEEMSGLFNWALEGLERLQKQKGFTKSKSTEELKEIWISKSDSFQAFCSKYIREDYEGNVKKQDLLRFYSKYCKINKLRLFGNIHIKYILEKEFGAFTYRKEVDHEKVSFWSGIQLKDNVKELLENGQERQDKHTILTLYGI